MNLATAQKYAAAIKDWLAPQCERIEIAGSIRRGLAVCNDVDIVAIPKTKEGADLAGPTGEQHNLLWEFLVEYVKASNGRAQFKSGGQVPGKQALLRLPKCDLDVWFATERTWATRFLQRTGSMEHNIWLCSRAQDRGMKWQPYDGLLFQGRILSATTETQIYEALGLAYIEPANRCQSWIKKHLEFGMEQ